MASLEDALESQQSQRLETDKSLKKTLEENEAKKKEEHIRSLRSKIAGVLEQIDELRGRLKVLDKSDDIKKLDEQKQTNREGLRTITGELRDLIKKVEVLYSTNKNFLKEQGIENSKALYEHKEYGETGDIKQVKDLYTNKFKSALETIRSTVSAAEVLKTEQKNAEPTIHNIEKSIIDLENTVQSLSEQLPEEKAKRQAELALLLKEKIGSNAASMEGILTNLKFWQTAPLKEMKNKLPKEYFGYMEKEGYGRAFVESAIKEAVNAVMQDLPISKELSDTKMYLQETQYSEEDRKDIERRGEKLMDELESMNTFLKAEGSGKIDKSFLPDPMGAYFTSLDLFKGYINQYDSGTKSFLKNKLEELQSTLYGNTGRGVPKKSKVEHMFSTLEKLFAEIKTVHEKKDTENPLHLVNAFADDASKTSTYLVKEYNFLTKDFMRPAESTLLYKKEREKGRDKAAILEVIEKTQNKLTHFQDMVSGKLIKIPQYIENAEAQESIEKKFGNSLEYEEKKLNESTLSAEKALSDIQNMENGLKNIMDMKIKNGASGLESALPFTTWNYDEENKKESDLISKKRTIENKKISFFQQIFGGQRKKNQELEQVNASLKELEQMKKERSNKIEKENAERKRVNELIEPMSKYITMDFIRDKAHGLDINNPTSISDIILGMKTFYQKNVAEKFPIEKTNALKELGKLNGEKKTAQKDIDVYMQSKDYVELQKIMKDLE